MAWTSRSEEVVGTLAWYIAQASTSEEAKLELAYDKAFNQFPENGRT